MQQSTNAGTQNRYFTYDQRGFLASEQHPEKGTSGNGLVSYFNYDPRGGRLPIDLHQLAPRSSDDDCDDLPKMIAGYVQDFGFTADSEESARQLAAAEIVDGSVSWSDSKSYPVSIRDLPSAIIEKVRDWVIDGIWYKSGRVFFPPD